MSVKEFKNVALLITNYNRSQSLEKLLKSFKDLNVSFGQIVVSDDGSAEEHILRLKPLCDEYGATLVLAEKNSGLGNNINKGQNAVVKPYTLYVQEDFKPKAGAIQAIEDGLDFMSNDAELDIVRFYAYRLYPYLVPLKKGFSLMNFKLSHKGYWKFHAYSDHPHLRRSSFLDKFGAYPEGYNPEQTEYRMVMSFLQKKGKGLFYVKHKDLFDHSNNEDEPSTLKRNNLRRSDNFAISIVRDIYRNIKFNKDYLFSK